MINAPTLGVDTDRAPKHAKWIVLSLNAYESCVMIAPESLLVVWLEHVSLVQVTPHVRCVVPQRFG
jgi:hypothetical protein